MRCLVAAVGIFAMWASASRADDTGQANKTLGQIWQEQQIVVTGNGAHLASTYLGRPSYPQPNTVRIYDGHLQLFGPTGAWASQTNLVTVVANRAFGDDGSQGGFWDPNYRVAYGGQDGAAIYVGIQGRIPVVTNAAASFGKAAIATPAGNRTVYTVVLADHLTPREMDEVRRRPVNLRIEAGEYFGYLIPPGFSSPAGQSVPPVSTDGSTLVVDNWVCATCKPVVPASLDAVPPVGATVTVDALHQVDGLYGGWVVRDGDGLNTAMNFEQANINNRVGVLPALNLLDPVSTPLLLVSRFEGVVSDNVQGQGAGVADDVCTTGWQACFVARNMATAKTGNTVGFLAPTAGPTFGFYSTQNTGYVLAVDPGDACQQPGEVCRRTALLDTRGNLALSGVIIGSSVVSAGSIKASGPVTPGRFALSSAPTCGTETVGAHIYIVDGRKPGERPGAGSGTPADCSPPALGKQPAWISVYDYTAVRH